MSRTARFFDIIQILRQAEEPVIANTLAETLDVNIRTIYRDIASLQASGVPIAGETGIGYVMQKGYDLPPLMFSQDELEAIGVGLSLLGRSGDSGLVEAANRVAAKIADASSDRSEQIGSLHVSTWNQIPNSGLSPQKAREIIRNAIEITITYKNLKDQISERTIQPIALFYYVDAILIIAWCKLREEFRNFRIDRIISWKESGSGFEEIRENLLQQWETKQGK